VQIQGAADKAAGEDWSRGGADEQAVQHSASGTGRGEVGCTQRTEQSAEGSR